MSIVELDLAAMNSPFPLGVNERLQIRAATRNEDGNSGGAAHSMITLSSDCTISPMR